MEFRRAIGAILTAPQQTHNTATQPVKHPQKSQSSQKRRGTTAANTTAAATVAAAGVVTDATQAVATSATPAAAAATPTATPTNPLVTTHNPSPGSSSSSIQSDANHEDAGLSTIDETEKQPKLHTAAYSPQQQQQQQHTNSTHEKPASTHNIFDMAQVAQHQKMFIPSVQQEVQLVLNQVADYESRQQQSDSNKLHNKEEPVMNNGEVSREGAVKKDADADTSVDTVISTTVGSQQQPNDDTFSTGAFPPQSIFDFGKVRQTSVGYAISSVRSGLLPLHYDDTSLWADRDGARSATSASADSSRAVVSSSSSSPSSSVPTTGQLPQSAHRLDRQSPTTTTTTGQQDVVTAQNAGGVEVESVWTVTPANSPFQSRRLDDGKMRPSSSGSSSSSSKSSTVRVDSSSVGTTRFGTRDIVKLDVPLFSNYFQPKTGNSNSNNFNMGENSGTYFPSTFPWDIKGS